MNCPHFMSEILEIYENDLPYSKSTMSITKSGEIRNLPAKEKITKSKCLKCGEIFLSSITQSINER